MRSFESLSEREILGLAISSEEEDGPIYGDFAEGLETNYPATAAMFRDMQKEEDGHRRALLDQYQKRFGDHIPLIRRQDVRGFVRHRPVWLTRPLGIYVVRRQAQTMDLETRRFYERSAQRC